ncbi:C40 family peptidase [Gracilinema caldarium]|uniref:C40 family peptidase n=1 Tax=Gracilinema caldarium TaxID=215591 RepID=UPI0026F12CD9|nr:NlpC/P60 family protein [Gracilinema caldarium]
MTLAVIMLAFIFASCNIAPMTAPERIPAPEEVRLQALDYARQYISLGAEYEWGGQDPLPRKIVVDCSGLVIRCYAYATSDYGYSLSFTDTTAAGMRQYSIGLSKQDLQPGDLLFMGTDGAVSHIALFVKIENGNIYFIDSTYKPEEGINGVTERFYSETDSHFIAFGRMLVQKL